MHFYAGIGSRKTPIEMLELMEQLAYWLADDNCVLRSGHAPGADQAFERGAAYAHGPAEIFLPWQRFEAQVLTAKEAKVYPFPSKLSYEIAEFYHPNWEALSKGGRMLMARNVHQVLGYDLEHPIRFVLCWTPGGAVTGGTGQALRIAEDHDISIFNLAIPEVETICRGWVT